MSDLSGEVVRVLAERRAALDDDAELTLYPGIEDLEREIIAASVVERRALYDMAEKIAEEHSGIDDFYGDGTHFVCECCGDEAPCPSLSAVLLGLGSTGEADAENG